MRKSVLIVLGLIFLASCREEVVESRSFYMGFTQDGKTFSGNSLDTEKSDIIHFHFDNPFAAIQDQHLAAMELTETWPEQKKLIADNTKIYLSVSPFNESWSGPDVQQVSRHLFKTTEIKQAYLNYCINLIDYFEPQYFNIASKANLVYLHHPEAWSDFLDFHGFIYTQLKARYPNLTVFSSMSAEPLIEQHQEVDRSLQRLAALQLLANSDLYGITLESKTINEMMRSNLKKPFEELFLIDRKLPGIELESDPNLPGFIQNFDESSLFVSCHVRKAVFLVSNLSYEKLPAYESREVWNTYFRLPHLDSHQ